MSERQECQHDINQKNHTMIISRKRFLVFPPIINARCTVCGETFQYIKKSGTFDMVSKEEKE